MELFTLEIFYYERKISWIVLIKGGFVLQTYSGYENKVKENLLQRAQTYNMLDNILRVEIPTQTVQS